TMWGLELGYGLGGGGELGEVFKEPDRHVLFDLGAWFWIDRSLILFTKIGGGFPNYVLSLSDGRRAPDGSLIYTPLIVRGSTDNLANELNRSFFLQENSFELIKARHFKMDYHLVHHSLRSGMREIQLFGRGFLPQVSLRSPLIELGRNPRVLSNIEWEAEIPSGTELKFRTRTGNQLKTEIHYYTNTGVEVTEKKYRKLLSFQKGDSVVTTIPGEGWSNWSRFYSLSGVAVASPSPRQFALVEATLTTDDPNQAVALRRLNIRLDDPLASRLTGEIAPQLIEQNGRLQSFSLLLQAQLQGGDFGFDQLLVELPPGTIAALEDVAVGTESELAAGGGLIYGLDELVRYDTGADSLWVKLPAPIELGQQLVALRFAAELFLASNPFTLSVGLGEGKEQVWQRVDAGDASSLGAGSDMTVFLPFDSGMLGAVEVSSNPFTPNGDGINDVVEFTFPIFKILGSKMLLLEVFGLDGRLVQRLEKRVVNIAGRQRVVWDGRNFSNELVPPGLYLCRLGLAVDAPDEEVIVSKIVASVY
ncbi:MAG: hypothetical protein CME16_03785, partial [Gemmatimonadetes bacterium]|nr:hypothetical protein [Gemmatimonadota bacterium]